MSKISHCLSTNLNNLKNFRRKTTLVPNIDEVFPHSLHSIFGKLKSMHLVLLLSGMAVIFLLSLEGEIISVPHHREQSVEFS